MASADKKTTSTENRWWIDRDKARGKSKTQEQQAPAGASFFRVVEGYDQDQALDHLTDLNLKLLAQGEAPAGGWGYISLVADKSPAREMEKVKRALPLPPFARAVIVDSGLSLRVIVTGTPVGERILEFNFVQEASFDCWIRGEWVREELFASPEELRRNAARLLNKYLEKPAAEDERLF
jgi:acyl-CoA synthetase (AMP-forming)/AMP-acid ligase II